MSPDQLGVIVATGFGLVCLVVVLAVLGIRDCARTDGELDECGQ